MWLPAIMGGKPHRQNARGTWGFYSKGDTFREALNHILMRDGGDFQNALSPLIRSCALNVARRSAMDHTRVHVWEREISDLPDCKDLVNPDHYVSDFMGDCE